MVKEILRKEKKFFLVGGVGIILLLMAAIFLLFYANKLFYPTIIHFNRLEGVDFLGDINDLIGVLTVSFVFLVINFVLALQVFLKDKVSGYILLASNILISLLVFIIICVVISNN